MAPHRKVSWPAATWPDFLAPAPPNESAPGAMALQAPLRAGRRQRVQTCTQNERRTARERVQRKWAPAPHAAAAGGAAAAHSGGAVRAGAAWHARPACARSRLLAAKAALSQQQFLRLGRPARGGA
jgi:hypothetical protein